MGRRNTVLTKVTRRGDDAGPEMMLPESISHHTGGQRVVFLYQPVGQRDAAGLLLLTCLEIQRPDDSQGIRRHFLPLLHWVAAIETVRRARLSEGTRVSEVDI